LFRCGKKNSTSRVVLEVVRAVTIIAMIDDNALRYLYTYSGSLHVLDEKRVCATPGAAVFYFRDLKRRYIENSVLGVIDCVDEGRILREYIPKISRDAIST
jgi:hypothetical protein